MGDSITAGYTDNPTWDVPFEFGCRQELFERLQKSGFQQRGCKVTTVAQYRNMLKPDGTIDPGFFSNKINHPTAYDRMAQTWFKAIQSIFPSVKK